MLHRGIKMALLAGFLGVALPAQAQDTAVAPQVTSAKSQDTAQDTAQDTTDDTLSPPPQEVQSASNIQTSNGDSDTSSAKPLSKELKTNLDEQSEKVKRLKDNLSGLQGQIKKSTGLFKRVLLGREDATRSKLLTEALSFATEVADRQDEGFDVSVHRDDALELLKSLPSSVYTAISRSNDSDWILPEKDINAAKQTALDVRQNRDSQQVDGMLHTLLEGLKVLKRYGFDTQAEKKRLRRSLLECARMRSVILEVAIEDSQLFTDQLSQLPDDEDLAAKVRVMNNRVGLMADALRRSVGMMSALKMDVTAYEAQVLEATGEITANLLDTEVVSSIFDEWLKTGTDWFDKNGLSLLFQAFLFIFILAGFWVLSRLVKKILVRTMNSSKVKLSELLSRMIVSFSKNLVVFIGLLIALSQVGVSVGPVLAGLGVAGFILGFALQETLSNFASGMMILLYRPFDVGDLLEAGGVLGTVSHMSLVNTTILTLDNQTLIIPNNKIWGDTIKNVTAQKVRRVDMKFGISYSDDIPKAEKVLLEIVQSCDKVLPDPPVNIRLHELGDSSVNFVVRPWANTADYWDVYWDITRKVKMVFDENNISIPFPQRDIHLFESGKNSAP